MGAETEWLDVRTSHQFAGGGSEIQRITNIAFLVFRYLLHHFHNLAECLSLSIRQGYPDTNITVSN